VRTNCSTHAVRESRETDRPLLAAVESALEPEIWAAIAPHLPTADDYLGSTSRICTEVVSVWQAGGRRVGSTSDGSASERKQDQT